jgi:hypothetical protein
MGRIKQFEKPATPDVIWKILVTKFFDDFLKIFKPDLYKEIISEKTEFLEKELLSLTGKKKKGIVDVLAKVYLKNGLEEYVLLHIEIQGNVEENFVERMFAYYIRIWDKYRKPVVSLALMLNRSKNKSKANRYSLETFGTKLSYEFVLTNVSHLNYEKCLRSNNPVEVAISILIETSGIPRWKRKIEAIRRLNKVGLDQELINILMTFVDRILKLSPTELEKFKEYEIKEAKEVNMIMTTWEENGIKIGMRRGLKKGIEQGIEKGIEQGIEQGRFESVVKLSKKGFTLEQISDILELDLNYVKKLLDQVSSFIK